MKRPLLIFILLIIGIMNLWSQNFPEKEGALVKVFDIGGTDGSLGYSNFSDAEINGPTAFCFDKNLDLYIDDTINRRICIFGSGYNYIKSIGNSPIICTGALEINENGDIIGYIGNRGIAQMDSEGNKFFVVSTNNNKALSDLVDKDKGFFIDGDIVFAYKKDGGLIGYKNPGPDYKENNRNVITDTDEVVRTIQQNHPSLRVEKETPVVKQSASRTGVPQRSSTSEEGYQVFQNGELLSRSFEDFEQNTGLKTALQSRSASTNNPCYTYMEDHPDVRKTLYGSDDDGNTFWKVGSKFMVFNSSGMPIAGFIIDREKMTTSPVMSPSGDVYYMHSDETGHYLYKIDRDW